MANERCDPGGSRMNWEAIRFMSERYTEYYRPLPHMGGPLIHLDRPCATTPRANPRANITDSPIIAPLATPYGLVRPLLYPIRKGMQGQIR
jgi:hypothetical protein